MAKKPLSKEELVARLKAMAADETPRERHPGAMCYSICMPPENHLKCDMCGKDICYHSWNHETVIEMVDKMKKLGYDVKVDTVCETCAKKLKVELYPDLKKPDDDGYDEFKDIHIFDINHIFYFRTSSDEQYHRAIAYHPYNYKPLLALMQNEHEFLDGHGANHFTDEEKESLEFMTGINFDE